MTFFKVGEPQVVHVFESSGGVMSGREAPQSPEMKVRKRNGSTELVDLNKILRAVQRCASGLADVDSLRVATNTIGGIYDGTSTQELDQLSIHTAASLIADEPQYAKLAARLLHEFITKEVQNQGICAFSQSIERAAQLGIVNDRVATFVARNSRKLNDSVDVSRSDEFEFFGLRTLYDRYLLRHPTTRLVLETPQFFFMRIAVALTESVSQARELYELFSSLEYIPSSPTLFNAGTVHEQLSSCFLLDSPEDSIRGIYLRYLDAAELSKFSGGIGLAYHRVRSRGSLIKGTNGHSNGIVPWLKTQDSSVGAVNQCFAPETEIFTAEGPQSIRSVKSGDLVLGISGTYRKIEERMLYNLTEETPMVEFRVTPAVRP